MEQVTSTWRQVFVKDTFLPLSVICAGVFTHALNIFILQPMLPTIVQDIGGVSYYSLSTTSFILASVIGTAYVGSIYRSFGVRNTYYIAVTLFIAGAFVCATAPALQILIAGRVLQGFGGGMMVALSYTLLNSTIERSLWPRIMSLMSAMWGISTLIGPAVGGYMAEAGLWRLTFWLLIPIGIAIVLGAIAVFPKQDEGERKEIPVANFQLILVLLGVLLTSFSSVIDNIYQGISVFVLGLLLFIIFGFVESKSEVRLLPKGAVNFFETYGKIFAVIALLSMIVFWANLYMSYLLQTLRGQTPVVAGYIAALVAAGWTFTSFITASSTGKGIHRSVLMSPFFLLSATVILFVMMSRDGAASVLELALISLGIFMIGVGAGTAWPHIATWAMSDAPEGEGDLASGGIVLTQNVAMAVGGATAGLIANSTGLLDSENLEATKQAAQWVYGLLSIPVLLSVFFVVTLVRGRR